MVEFKGFCRINIQYHDLKQNASLMMTLTLDNVALNNCLQ